MTHDRQRPGNKNTSGRLLIGGSLSGCIADIYQGKVSQKDIDHIATQTTARNDEDWTEVFNSYRFGGAWRIGRTEEEKDEAATKCTKIAEKLLKNGKITQPKLTQEKDGLDRLKFHWFNAETKEGVDVGEHPERAEARRPFFQETFGLTCAVH